MKKVLLTGAAGFIGRHCLHVLEAANYEIHAVSSRPPNMESSRSLHWHQADLLDEAQVASLMARVQPEQMLHMAWYVEPGKYWTAPENADWVRASLLLLRKFAQCGGQRVVMAGTSAEYDWKYGYCSENLTPCNPGTPYGVCKHALGDMLHTLAGSCGISAAWGRIFCLYGPHEHPDRLVASVTRALLTGKPALCTSGRQFRDWLHVQDVADAFVALLQSSVTGPVNIGSGVPVAVKDIIHQIAQQTGGSDLLRLGARPTSPNEPPLVVADISRLTHEVNWSPHYSLQQGLKKTVAWWKEQP